MAAALELGPGFGSESVGLGLEPVGEPLVMEPRPVEGGLQRIVVHQQVQQHLDGVAGDAGAAPAAQGVGLLALPGDHRAHRGEHSLAGTDGIGLALDQAEEVGPARSGGKIVHLVVEEEAGAGHPEATAIETVQGSGERHEVAVPVHDGEMGGFAAGRQGCRGGGAGPGLHLRRCGGVAGIDLRRPVGDPCRIEQLGGGGFAGRRVAQQKAIGEGATEGFGQQMVAIGAEARELLPSQLLQHAQGLAQDDTAGGRQRHGGELPAEGLGNEWLAPDRLVGGEVGGRQHAAVGARRLLDRRGHGAGDDPLRPKLGVAAEGGGEVRLAQHAAYGRRLPAFFPAEIGEPHLDGFGEAQQELMVLTCAQSVVQVAADAEAFGGQPPGRLDHFWPGKAAVAALQLPQACRRAGDSRGQGPHQRSVFHRLALRVQVHAGPGPGRRRLAEVQRLDLASHAHQGEAAAPKIACLGVDHGKHQCGGHGGVHGITAGAQDREAGRGGQRVGRRHGAAGAGRCRNRGGAGDAGTEISHRNEHEESQG